MSFIPWCLLYKIATTGGPLPRAVSKFLSLSYIYTLSIVILNHSNSLDSQTLDLLVFESRMLSLDASLL